jgi:hypothetical protein
MPAALEPSGPSPPSIRPAPMPSPDPTLGTNPPTPAPDPSFSELVAIKPSTKSPCQLMLASGGNPQDKLRALASQHPEVELLVGIPGFTAKSPHYPKIHIRNRRDHTRRSLCGFPRSKFEEADLLVPMHKTEAGVALLIETSHGLCEQCSRRFSVL